MYVRFPLSHRNVEDLLHERGIDISRETVRLWWNRFGPLFASEIRKKRKGIVTVTQANQQALSDIEAQEFHGPISKRKKRLSA